MVKPVVLGALLAVSTLGGPVVAEAAAAPGGLIQKPRAAGCLGALGICSPGRALDSAGAVTVSPDGRNAYVASNGSDAVVIFDRARDGRLIQKRGSRGCTSETGAGSCADGKALLGAADVAVSPNGRSVYVASYGNDVAVFDRAANGSLTQKPGTAGCLSDAGNATGCVAGNFLSSAVSVVVSPDGRSVYVASYDGAVAIIDRARDGTLSQDLGPAGCISLSEGWGGCAGGRALDHAASVTVSPDGKNVYVASELADDDFAFDSPPVGGVAVFDRAGDGALTQKHGRAGCITDSGSDGECFDGRALDGARSVTVSQDGRSVYVASSAASTPAAGRWPYSTARGVAR